MMFDQTPLHQRDQEFITTEFQTHTKELSTILCQLPRRFARLQNRFSYKLAEIGRLEAQTQHFSKTWEEFVSINMFNRPEWHRDCLEAIDMVHLLAQRLEINLIDSELSETAKVEVKCVLRILAVASRNKKNQDTLLENRGVEFLFKFLARDTRRGIELDLCVVLRRLAVNAGIEKKIGDLEGVSILFELIESYKEEEEIQREICSVLGNVLCEVEHKKSLTPYSLKLLIEILNRHSTNCETVKVILRTIANGIGKNKKNKQHLSAVDGAVESIMGIFDNHSNYPDCSSASLRCLAHMAQISEARQLIAQHSGLYKILSIIRKTFDDENFSDEIVPEMSPRQPAKHVKRDACVHIRALVCMTYFTLDGIDKNVFQEENGLGFITRIMKLHPECLPVQSTATLTMCRVVRNFQPKSTANDITKKRKKEKDEKENVSDKLKSAADDSDVDVVRSDFIPLLFEAVQRFRKDQVFMRRTDELMTYFEQMFGDVVLRKYQICHVDILREMELFVSLPDDLIQIVSFYLPVE